MKSVRNLLSEPKALSAQFAKAGPEVFRFDEVASASFARIEELVIEVRLRDGRLIEVRDIDAVDFAMVVKPSALEGKRLRYAKHAWALHNLLAHPLMQVLAFFGAYKWAFRVHDSTVPRPLGVRQPRNTSGEPR